MTSPSFPTEKMSQSVHRSCLNFSCVKHGPYQNFQFISSWDVLFDHYGGSRWIRHNIPEQSKFSMEGEGGGVHMDRL